MDGVSDAAYRFISKKYGWADVVYTEFVSAEGLWRINKREEMGDKIWKDLVFDPSERPVVAQLFGSDPQSFYDATIIVAKMGFNGIDINMGCPSPGLEKRCGGAGLIRAPELAQKIITETRRAVADLGLDVPVSLKTRIGSKKAEPEWWEFLATLNMPVIAMHGRSFKQLYAGEADWEALEEAAKVIRKTGTTFLANGDIGSIIGEAGIWKIVTKTEKEIVLNDKFDGILIGRGGMGNPWIFRKDGFVPDIQGKLKVMVEHAKKYEEIFVGERFFAMRKHLSAYAKGFDGAAELRKKLVMANSASEVAEIVEEYC